MFSIHILDHRCCGLNTRDVEIRIRTEHRHQMFDSYHPRCFEVTMATMRERTCSYLIFQLAPSSFLDVAVRSGMLNSNLFRFFENLAYHLEGSSSLPMFRGRELSCEVNDAYIPRVFPWYRRQLHRQDIPLLSRNNPIRVVSCISSPCCNSIPDSARRQTFQSLTCTSADRVLAVVQAKVCHWLDP